MERTRKLLSAKELIAATDAIDEVEAKILNHGLKSKFPLATSDEAATIKSYQDDLRRLISMERIARRMDRSTARIEDGLVKIVKRVGKWKLFGSGNCLRWHEALYLMEMNRLDVYYDSVIVSLERAYSMFLRKSTDARDCDKLTKEEYAVYSHFMRSGFTIQVHTLEAADTDNSMSRLSNESDSRSRTERCIWAYLFELLGQRQRAAKRGKVDSETYDRVKVSMDSTISSLKSQNTNQSVVPQKRKFESGESTSREYQSTKQYLGTEPLHAFMIGDERRTFRKVFDKIDVIRLSAGEIAGSTSIEALRFSFDLWTDVIHKKTDCTEPNYRMVVLGGIHTDLPNIRLVQNLFKRQKHKCPIILVYVSDELAFHAYVYRFTT